MNEEALTVMQVAELLSVNEKTVQRMADEGTLPSFRVGKLTKTGGHRRFKRSDIEAYMKGETK